MDAEYVCLVNMGRRARDGRDRTQIKASSQPYCPDCQTSAQRQIDPQLFVAQFRARVRSAQISARPGNADNLLIIGHANGRKRFGELSSRTSGENRLGLAMTPSSQGMEPPRNSGRFTPGSASTASCA
jgi:hypothetical protein